jgi:tRNA (Thr-GGU) A37 N-methylase
VCCCQTAVLHTVLGWDGTVHNSALQHRVCYELLHTLHVGVLHVSMRYLNSLQMLDYAHVNTCIMHNQLTENTMTTLLDASGCKSCTSGVFATRSSTS